MRFGSVCSGIEAASVAWHPLGWSAAWLAEIESFPSAVLAHHYPDVPNLGDMTALPDRIMSGDVEAPDIFCGGTPCQAFSVAGLRKSLDDARGNLSLVFCEIANAIDHIRRARGDEPAIVFWENVPGVLSTKDNAFGCFLAGLAGEDDPLEPAGGKWTNAGYVSGPARTVAWRVLDAQYFGLAQRRRRVFVVASARNDFDPAAILFEFDGLRRDSPPSREAGKVAPTIPARSTGGGGLGTDFDCDGGVIAAYGIPGNVIGRSDVTGGNCAGFKQEVSYTLTKQDKHAVAYDIPGNWIGRQPENGGNSTQFMEEMSPCLTSADRHGVAQPMAFAQNTRDEVRYINGDGQIAGALAAESGMKQTTYVAQPTVGAFFAGQGAKAGSIAYDHHVAPTLKASDSGTNRTPSVHVGMAVRRLTPVECERLQGFPDGYTQIPWRKKPAEDCPGDPRYKALGNSWAVPVVRWIGERIQRAIEISNQIVDKKTRRFCND